MFLGLTNPKLCVLVNAIVVNLCEITELRNKQFKVEIIQKNSEKEIIIYFGFYNN